MKNKLTAIRVEHPDDGLGIFWTRKKGTNWFDSGYPNCLDRIDLFSYDSETIGRIENRHIKMTPAYNIEGFTKQHFCAYTNLQTLISFINFNEINKLIKLNFRIYRLTLRDAIVDKDQLLYIKKDIIKKDDITEMFNK